METFRLARMTKDLFAMTAGVLCLPVLLAAAAGRAPEPTRAILLAAAAVVVVLYLSVWLFFRPNRFEVDGRGLAIVWPARSSCVAVAEIRGVAVIDREQFRRQYGYGVRIGAGGLWGGFGWLKTGNGMLSMYISRTDSCVLIDRAGGRPLMITPENPGRFVTLLQAAVARNQPPGWISPAETPGFEPGMDD